jgi:hypothetical protein
MDKQSILEEIKRIAQLSDGVPPGKAKFSRESGIKNHEWLGRFWVR